jgi:glycosyltransferase involved in cell wall biosynthesis
MGKKAKQTALKYDVENVLPKYVKIFEEITQPDPEVTVIVTRRKGESDEITLKSLEKQSYGGIKEIIRVEDAFARGANWARNKCLQQVTTPYVLFSDNDISWKPWAISKLARVLKNNKDISYAYGTYLWTWEKDGKVKTNLACNEEWSAERLKDYSKGNFVSTMSLVRTKDFCGFDENVKRLQDWDVWLTMLEQGKKGKHCGDIIFETDIKKGGISCDNPYTYEMALKDLIKKHKPYESCNIHKNKR